MIRDAAADRQHTVGMAFTPTTQQQRLLELVSHGRNGVLVTLKRDGRPQLSNISYHYDPAAAVARISVTADRAKTRNLQRDPRASLHVSSPDFWSWTVLDGTATLSEVATAPGDAAADELVELYRQVNGEHPDWDEYRAAMVTDRRQVVRLAVTHVYGQVPAS
ncbi:PPOX class F420-dependent oxidoreductase [soil metagenome]